MLRIQLLLSTEAVVIQIELLCSSIRRLPPNRANKVVVFEGNPVRYKEFMVAVFILLYFAQKLM